MESFCKSLFPLFCCNYFLDAAYFYAEKTVCFYLRNNKLVRILVCRESCRLSLLVVCVYSSPWFLFFVISAQAEVQLTFVFILICNSIFLIPNSQNTILNSWRARWFVFLCFNLFEFAFMNLNSVYGISELHKMYSRSDVYKYLKPNKIDFYKWIFGFEDVKINYFSVFLSLKRYKYAKYLF